MLDKDNENTAKRLALLAQFEYLNEQDQELQRIRELNVVKRREIAKELGFASPIKPPTDRETLAFIFQSFEHHNAAYELLIFLQNIIVNQDKQLDEYQRKLNMYEYLFNQNKNS